DMADRITIMRHGEVMEDGETARTLSEQVHPYTRQLAQASMHVPKRKRYVTAAAPLTPSGARQAARPARGGGNGEGPSALLSVENVIRDYPGRRTSLFRKPAPFRAVDGVSFSLRAGQSVALVG